jgi:methyl-accepting chemotaxis protein
MRINKSIKNKIITMILVILVIIMVSTSYILSSIKPVSESWINYQEQATSRQTLLMNIKSNFGYGGMIHNFKNYVLRGQDKYLPRIAKNYQGIQDNITRYQGLTGVTDAEQQALDNVFQVAKNYYENSILVSNLFSQGKTPEQVDSVVKISDKPALSGFEILNQSYLSLSNQSNSEVDSALYSTRLAIMICLSVVALTISMVLISLYLSIVPALTLLNKSMHEIAAGDGDISIRLDDSKQDELGLVAQAFNQFVTKLENMIREQKEIVSQIYNSAENLKEVTRTSNESIEFQLSNTEQLATAINEMTATVQDISKNAVEASDSTVKVNHAAHLGQDAVVNTLSQIDNIHRHLSDASKLIDEVNSASDDIGQVLNVISSIADQTNLLALNAAIEAARAGESGRGFAVVADEVRALAQRTGSSLSDIQTIIEQLQSGTQKAVTAMSLGVNEVSEGTAVANVAGESIRNIVASIEIVENMSLQIATATEEQSAVSDEMNKNVHDISGMSSTIHAGSKEISAQTRNLASLAERLEVLTNSFKTS